VYCLILIEKPLKIKNTLLLLLVFNFGCASVFSQQGKVDPTFNTYDDGLLGDGFDNTVRTLSVQDDGKLIVGGDFLNFNGVATPYLCRLLPDGSKDASFFLGTGFNNKVYTSLLQPDGKILVDSASSICSRMQTICCDSAVCISRSIS
jgi:hypothetical protein